MPAQALDALSAAPPTEAHDPLAATKNKPFDEAMTKLKLNEQEQNLYQMHLHNLAAGGVPNQGKTSTLFASTFEIEGKTYVIPTVWNGQLVPPNQALELAKQYGLDKFPAYASEREAQQRYDEIHGFMEQDLTEQGR